MDQQLTTNQASGFQNSTQSPQSTGQSATQNVAPSTLQSNSDSSVFNSSNGISLAPTPLTTVNVSGGTTSQTQQSSPTTAHHHNINSTFLGLAVLLLLVAVVTFWQISKQAKNTTF